MTEMEKEVDVLLLDELQSIYESEISNFSLEATEDIYDEEGDTIVRNLVWNRGLKNYNVVYTATGTILAYSKRMPRELLVDMLNKSIEFMVTDKEID